MNNNQKILLVVGIVVAVVLVALFTIKPATQLGRQLENTVVQFKGIVVGDSITPGCIKIADRDQGGGMTYVTYQDGTQYVTGGTAAALAAGSWEIPAACQDTSLIDLRAR